MLNSELKNVGKGWGRGGGLKKYPHFYDKFMLRGFT